MYSVGTRALMLALWHAPGGDESPKEEEEEVKKHAAHASRPKNQMSSVTEYTREINKRNIHEERGGRHKRKKKRNAEEQEREIGVISWCSRPFGEQVCCGLMRATWLSIAFVEYMLPTCMCI